MQNKGGYFVQTAHKRCEILDIFPLCYSVEIWYDTYGRVQLFGAPARINDQIRKEIRNEPSPK